MIQLWETAYQYLNVLNVGFDTLTAFGYDLYSNNFELIDSTFPIDIAPMDAESSFVSFTPSNMQSYSDQLYLNTNDGYQTISLSGVGVMPDLEVDLTIATLDGYEGDLVYVPIDIGLSLYNSISSFSISISGFSGIIDFDSINVMGDLLESMGWIIEYNLDNETLNIAAAGSNAITSPGTLLELAFDISDGSSGFVPLNILFLEAIFDTGQHDVYQRWWGEYYNT